jgi:DNA-binding MarR family transcriptional regulator
LEEAGLITRQPNPADRRGVLVAATPAGEALMARRDEVSNAWLAARLDKFTVADRLALERAVELLEVLAGEKEPNKEVGS